MTNFIQDLRYALRLLLKHKGAAKLDPSIALARG